MCHDGRDGIPPSVPPDRPIDIPLSNAQHVCIVFLQERLLTIKDAAEALETARYQNLWAVLNSRGPVFDLIPGWRTEIRKSAYIQAALTSDIFS